MENLKNSFQVFAFIALCLFAVTPLSAQGWDRFLPDSSFSSKIVELPNGDFVFYKNTIKPSDTSTTWTRLDKLGRVKHIKKTSYFNGTKSLFYADGFLWASSHELNYTAGIYQFDTANYINVYRRNYSNIEINEILKAPNGSLLFVGNESYFSGFGGVFWPLAAISFNPITHNTDWQKTYPQDSVVTLINSDFRHKTVILNNRIYVMNSTGGVSVFDMLGRRLSIFTFDNKGSVLRMVANKDQTLTVFNYTNSQREIVKVDSEGNVKWRKGIFTNPSTSHSLEPLNEGGVWDIRSYYNYTTISKLDSRGNELWLQILPRGALDPDLTLNNVLKTADGSLILYGRSKLDTVYKSRILKLTSDGSTYAAGFVGTVRIDDNNNCLGDATERPLKNWLVIATSVNSAESFWATTDSVGNYRLPCFDDTYSLRLIPPRSTSWRLCPTRTRTVVENSIDTVDFAVGKWTDCPALQVDLGTPFMRRCFENTTNVAYKNVGTADARNAYITIKLDSLQEFISASRPLSSRAGQVLRFNFDAVAIGDIGSFNLTTRVRCGDSTRLGQIICMEANIFPNERCYTPFTWSGAELAVTGQCLGDSVEFRIQNIGTVPSSLRNYYIVWDDVVYRRGAIQLNVGEERVFRFPANGGTWRIVVDQEPNHPFNQYITAAVEGCRADRNLPFHIGYYLLYADDDGNPTTDNDCQPIQGAFDPNDKKGYPLGFLKDTTKPNLRYVLQNQDVTYLIRFQNTGTDTAFTVVVMDTLSKSLDIDSIEWGASSHPYRAEVIDKRTLRFTFDNINLIDSNRNELKSHGYVKFRVKQKKNVVIGTEITNRAAIYFDYNAPVMTNTTRHIVGKLDDIPLCNSRIPICNTVKTEDITLLKAKIIVSPNPFSETTTVHIETEYPLSNWTFELYNVIGKHLRTEKFTDNALLFERKDLPNGFYIFRILSEGKWIGSGKISVTH